MSFGALYDLCLAVIETICLHVDCVGKTDKGLSDLGSAGRFGLSGGFGAPPDTEIYSILPQDVMTVDISVDELDIGSINVGGPVIVSLDSLPGQSFEGKIVSVDKEGTYDSGNTKYTVTVSVARTEQMYAGMNAGIKIDTSGDEEYLTVPAAALTDEGGKTYVYTGYNEEENELEGKTEVTTGLSDGEDVEITSGLKAGDEVCYRYADTIEYTFVRK